MRRTLGLIAVALLSGPVAAHHSNAEYDFAAVEELDGEIAAVFWRNPHVRMTLRVQDAQGGEKLWELEAQDVNSLERRGLAAEMLRTGERVKVAGNPSRRRVQTMFVTNVLLPSNVEIRMRGDNTAPRWATATAGFDAPTRNAATAAALAAHGLFRVWLLSEGAPIPPERLPLTPAARAAVSRWTPADNPMLKCIAPGMPFAALGGRIHPIELLQRDGDIVFRGEAFDIARTIRMDADGAPEPPATPLGYSEGRWENDVLVVRTTRISWPFFDSLGRIPQSEGVVVDERFSILAATDQLVYEQTVTDPATFTQPVSSRYVYDWHPELVVEPYECVTD